ncbi:hypothetical protein [uncultured Roseivirga sp.]|uniref:hypothetical protein n=1 Tax=uncultured Roseivirga sp. TaxID=543088 RepID=UPI0030D81C75|tara:strand:+ start:282103 stop:282549 length:447 start_codon:yes stop_codon:yes gene_type:complete
MDEIFVVKSAMHEEGANGFTRKNYMVLNYNFLSAHLFEHELFHIISRYNSDKIKQAYGILGFNPCNEIEIPSTMIDFKITNPDALFNNFYINLNYENKKVSQLYEQIEKAAIIFTQKKLRLKTSVWLSMIFETLLTNTRNQLNDIHLK